MFVAAAQVRRSLPSAEPLGIDGKQESDVIRFLHTLAAGASLLVSVAANAHSGHGTTSPGDGAVHYLAEPDHVVVTLLGIGLAAAAASIYSRFRQSRPARQTRR